MDRHGRATTSPMKVYRYGLLRPTENADLVRQQMRAAHVYRNALVEIERGRRAAARAAASAQHAIVGEAEKRAKEADGELDEALKEMLSARAQSRKRSETEPMRQRVQDARARRREARNSLREARFKLRVDDDYMAEVDRINLLAASLVRNARAYCGVYWGTYLLIEAEIEAARKMPLYDGLSPKDPHFVRWRGEGRVGVQLQGGLAAAQAFGSDTQLQIAAALLSPSGKRASKKDFRVLRLRVGSDGRAPIWASWPMLLHRPIPAGAIIKCATVQLRMIGPREEWSVCITVETEAQATELREEEAVAVDLGWRTRDTGLRACAWRGTDGRRDELQLTAELVSSLGKANELRGTRDANFDLARMALARWLSLTEEVPAWLTEAAKTLSHWKSPGRLAALVKRWAEERFRGDKWAYIDLETWRYKDHHLWEWETSQRVKSLRRRTEVYRIFAANLARRYNTLVLEDFDLRVFARRAPAEESAENELARSHRHQLATSSLRLALLNAFGKSRTVVVSAVNTTAACHVCGTVLSFDAAVAIDHRCEACGASWDQDDNACVNLLARWREQLCDEQSVRGARIEANAEIHKTKESKWVKAKKMAAERSSRLANRSQNGS